MKQSKSKESKDMPTQTTKTLTIGDVAMRIDEYRLLYAATERRFNYVEWRRQMVLRDGRPPGPKLVREWLECARRAGEIRRALQRFCATHHIELC